MLVAAQTGATIPSLTLNFRGGGKMAILMLIPKVHPSSSLTGLCFPTDTQTE